MSVNVRGSERRIQKSELAAGLDVLVWQDTLLTPRLTSPSFNLLTSRASMIDVEF